MDDLGSGQTEQLSPHCVLGLNPYKSSEQEVLKILTRKFFFFFFLSETLWVSFTYDCNGILYHHLNPLDC